MSTKKLVLFLMMKIPIDNFSKQSETYKKFRPTYPQELYEYILSFCKNYEVAWDCATGNGQVAQVLAYFFDEVLATDISNNQLKQIEKVPNLTVSLQRAEQTDFPNACFDLITVAQAIHWFDLKNFNYEVRRVLKHEGILAVWGYGLVRISPEIDALIDEFYTDIVGPYWNFERSHIDHAYQDIHVDLELLTHVDTFSIKSSWTLDQFEGFFNSWSAVQNYILAHDGLNPVDAFVEKVKSVWNSQEKAIMFPLFLKVYQKR